MIYQKSTELYYTEVRLYCKDSFENSLEINSVAYRIFAVMSPAFLYAAYCHYAIPMLASQSQDVGLNNAME